MDRLSSMEAFAGVADVRGFAAAARKLGVSPSLVTRRVADLEEHLGVRLLHRTTRNVTLTDAGRRYLERARAILAGVVEAEAAARRERVTPFGRFVVAAPETFGRREVAPLMTAFLEAHPDVVGELILSDRVVKLSADGVDLSIRIGHLADSALRARVVGGTRRVLVASPRYLAANRRPRRPEDLTKHRTIAFSSLTPTSEWRFFGKRSRRAVTVRPTLTTNSAEAAVDHAARGGGIALVLSYQVAERVRRKELEILLAAAEPPPIPIQLVYPGSPFPSAAVRAFVELTLATRQWDFVRI
jgi:DNA-binding transcriptional LysR family regulator